MNIIDDNNAYNDVINEYLDRLLSEKDDDLTLITDAMNYSIKNGGKST